MWTDTAAGEIELVNQPYLNYLGQTLEEVKDWPTALHPENRARVKAAWSRSVETGQQFDAEVRIRRTDGVYRWSRSGCSPTTHLRDAGRVQEGASARLPASGFENLLFRHDARFVRSRAAFLRFGAE